MDLIPRGIDFDIGGELFPLILEKRLSFNAIKAPFNWIDIGQLSDYWGPFRVHQVCIASMRSESCSRNSISILGSSCLKTAVIQGPPQTIAGSRLINVALKTWSASTSLAVKSPSPICFKSGCARAAIP